MEQITYAQTELYYKGMGWDFWRVMANTLPYEGYVYMAEQYMEICAFIEQHQVVEGRDNYCNPIEVTWWPTQTYPLLEYPNPDMC